MPVDPGESLSIDDDALTRPFRVLLWTVWGALLASVAGYVVVGQIVVVPGEETAPMAVVYGLAATAVGCALAAPILRARLLPPTAPPGGPGQMRRDEAARALGPYFVAHVLTLALFEAVAILGLVATFLTHEPIHGLAAAGVAAAGMLVYRPSDERVRGTLRAALEHPPPP
jgi:hypothetical protein